MQDSSYIHWLGDLYRSDRQAISQSYRRLSDLYLAGLPVGPGFVVTGQAIATLWQQPNLNRSITKILLDIDWHKEGSIAAAGHRLVKEAAGAALPNDLKETLEAAAKQLVDRLPSSVRLILTARTVSDDEPLGDPIAVDRPSRIGGALAHLAAQLFNAERLSQTALDQLNQPSAGVSILIQALAPVERSGYLTSSEQIVIQAIIGRPEPLINHHLTGDQYVVDRQSAQIVSRNIERQEWSVADVGPRPRHQSVPRHDQTRQKLADTEILSLSQIGIMLAQQSDFPLRAVWLLDDDERFWLTAVETIGRLADGDELSDQLSGSTTLNQAPILRTKPIGIGLAVGPVRPVADHAAADQVEVGDILLVESPDLLTPYAIAQAAGAVIETGQPSHPAVAALRQSGKPVLLGAGNAAQLLKPGMIVTLNGRHGSLMAGRQTGTASAITEKGEFILPTTGLKLFVRADEHTATSAEALPPDLADGIVPLSSSALFNRLGLAPHERTVEQGARVLTEQLVDELCLIAKSAAPRPVVLAAFDWPAEDRHLGYRGAHRAMAEPTLFKIELEAIRQAREDFGVENIHLMLPFVRTSTELTALSHMIRGAGLLTGPHFKLWLKAEAPATLALIKRTAKSHSYQAVWLDLDALTNLILGADLKHPQHKGEYDICDEAVLEAVEETISHCRAAGCPVVVASTSFVSHPSALERLVAAGPVGLAVSPESLSTLRAMVASIEKHVVVNAALGFDSST